METVDERIQKLDVMLDEYDSKVGVSAFKYDNQIENVLNYTQTDIRALAIEECGEDGYRLLRHAGYIQKECNRINARIRWLQRCVDIEIASRIKDYGTQYTSYNEKMFLVSNDPTKIYMKKLQDLIMHCEIRKEELSFLSSKVASMAQVLIEQKHAKRQQKWE